MSSPPAITGTNVDFVDDRLAPGQKQAGTEMKQNELTMESLGPEVTHDEEGKVIDLDAQLLRAQGHEAALERSFTWLGASALAYRLAHPPRFSTWWCILTLAVFQTPG